MIDADNVTGAILAGGRSIRMGRDKALLIYNGMSFLQRIAETLLQVVQRTIIISDNDNDHACAGLPVFADIVRASGPLGGIHSALSHAATPFVFILSCDTPFISPGLVKEMLDRAMPGDVTIAGDGTGMHPLVGIYPSTLFPALSDELGSGRRQVRGFLARSDVRFSLLPLPHRRQELRNINTPEDYAQL